MPPRMRLEVRSQLPGTTYSLKFDHGVSAVYTSIRYGTAAVRSVPSVFHNYMHDYNIDRNRNSYVVNTYIKIYKLV